MLDTWVWIAIGVVALAGILGVSVILTKRPVDVDDLGTVSDHWIAQSHMDSP